MRKGSTVKQSGTNVESLKILLVIIFSMYTSDFENECNKEKPATSYFQGLPHTLAQ